jgi:hypothetical protein
LVQSEADCKVHTLNWKELALKKLVIVLGAVVLVMCAGMTMFLFLGGWGVAMTFGHAVTLGPKPTSYPVTLNCPNCESAGSRIHLWRSPDHTQSFGIAGLAAHGDRCFVLDEVDIQGIQHYKVRCGIETGWVEKTPFFWIAP